MKRLLVLGLATAIALPVSAGSPVFNGSASAATTVPSACSGWIVGYTYRDKAKAAKPTSVASDWVIPNHGSITITYNQTAGYTNTVSGTVTLTAEASAIFAGASASIGVTVGGSWSQSKSWSYSATVSKDASHAYRLHLYHMAWSFEVMKIQTRTCNGQVQRDNLWSTWKTANHAPVKSGSANVWKIDKKAV